MTDTPAKTARILIADDEPDCVDFVRDALAETDCVVLSASDGEEALRVARQEKPDLVILDVQMPKHSGFEVFAQLKADSNLAAVPVIMLTAVTKRTGMKFSGQDMGEFYGAEPDAFIDKPIEPVVLRQTVARLLKGTGA